MSILMGFPLSLNAQSSPVGGAAHLEGQVFSEERTPLLAALISLTDLEVLGVTDSQGVFRIGPIPPGDRRVRVTLPGYLPTEFTVYLSPGQSMWLSLELETSPVIPLEGIDAQGTRTLSSDLREFHERRRQGNGHFFTRNEIETARPSRLTDLFLSLPGLEVVEVTGPFGSSQEVRFRRASGTSGRGPCRVGYVVNGRALPVAADLGINSLFRPDDVAGIEVYSGSSRIPAQFNSSGGSGRCGLILIWLYSGSR